MGQEQRVLYKNTSIHFLSYLSQVFLEIKMFRAKFVEEINPHILFYTLNYCSLRDV
jgi:hypothetical protein